VKACVQKRLQLEKRSGKKIDAGEAEGKDRAPPRAESRKKTMHQEIRQRENGFDYHREVARDERGWVDGV